MFNQTIFGMPPHCCNRNCKAPFTRDCHKGFQPKNEVEVYAIMDCAKCGDRFAVVQMIAIAHEYKKKLPLAPRTEAKGPISRKEINRLRKKLEDESYNPLASLTDGLRPGAVLPPQED